MIVDSSALVAVLTQEVDGDVYLEAMLRTARVRVAGPTLVETTLVMTRRAAGPLSMTRLGELVDLEVIGFSPAHAQRAIQAHAAYGRGSGHRARLDFGDCLVYGVASVEDEPLLFKGDDFAHTDLRPALGT